MTPGVSGSTTSFQPTGAVFKAATPKASLVLVRQDSDGGRPSSTKSDTVFTLLKRSERLKQNQQQVGVFRVNR